MKLYSLFISYSRGGHYCGVYTSLEDVVEVIQEAAGILIVVNNITLDVLKGVLEEFDEYWEEFTDSTWIHIQKITPELVERIKKGVIQEVIKELKT